MDDTERALREQDRGLWATAACFVLGVALGTLLLIGPPRPLAGPGSIMMPAALVAGAIAAAAFVVSTLMHRRGETSGMPRWQTVVSDVSSIAVTIAFGGVTALGTLLAAEVFANGLQGISLVPLAGGVFTGVASAVGGRLAFAAGVDLRTGDLAALLFGFLIIGTMFAMITAVDPRWWEKNFSQLGGGAGAWAFNGTLVIAGLLIATVGSYVGRDLHRLLGDGALRRIAVVVVAWALAGAALAAVGLLPITSVPTAHLVAATAALVLFVAAAAVTATALPREVSRTLRATTVAVIAVVILAVVLSFAVRLFSATALEAIVVGLALLWMSTLVRLLAILVPDVSRPSEVRSPLRGL
ncbi:DUF998 domain-containing protein [Microbacterium sp. KUDC0406]|uniref:DUF998 domain-containing protein n=1 Tax=Microbacterium sp. KUDC0406 TaxID=2909588 RepID=UPI001F38F139|nr:DUF998 domain-containing protein [Microbacterium sp. KUDC0406]UJP09338.1 DUF998 domain-containing protein [Microbacterium sp. KUDC0406]